MSRTPISPDDPDLGHLAGGTILGGEDRITVGHVYDDPEDVPMDVKTLRMPRRLVAAVEQQAHPEGFSGVVREAVAEWLERHGSPQAQADDAARALATLQRVLNRRAA
ncbi:hypothetical protein [Actinoplanes rectilineatus]|uniref:hypothetical protein n=1 Tax=Actinoplanes rectilineatus TaxID=113571 RepID=UPI0005F2CEAC|nr:hypothetical protein [Actinoplanes rectilineatus]